MISLVNTRYSLMSGELFFSQKFMITVERIIMQEVYTLSKSINESCGSQISRHS